MLGPLALVGIGRNLHWSLLGITCSTLGYSCIQIGIVARIMHGLRSGIAGVIQRWLVYDRGMGAAGVRRTKDGRWGLRDCALRSDTIAAAELPSNGYNPLYGDSKGSNSRHAATQVGIAQVASKHKAPVASNRRS